MSRKRELGREIKAAEEVLDHGSTQEARRIVLKLVRRRRIPRQHLFAIARLARLARMPEWSVRLLQRKVRSRYPWISPASDEEKAEYAAALDDLGASTEALSILEAEDPGRVRAVLLYRGFAQMNVWRYSDAVRSLELLVEDPRTAADPFGRLSSRMHLAHALILGPGEHRRAGEILKEVIAGSEAEGFPILRANALLGLLRSEVLRDRKTAAAALGKRIEREHAAQAAPRFLAEFQLWKAAAELPGSLSALREAGRRLAEAWDWEGLRLSEYLEARATGSPKLAARLFFGSPFPEFRAKVEEMAGGPGALPSSYHWTPPRSAVYRDAPIVEIDPVRGLVAPREARLKPGQALQRLLAALSEDFYRPKTVAGLFERLFPGEHFDPERSPDRVHQILRRFRSWAARVHAPLQVSGADGLFRLLSTAPCRITISRTQLEAPVAKPPVSSRFEEYLGKLGDEFRQKAFTAAEAARCLGISHRAAGLYLKAALAEARIEREGAGRATRYLCR